MGIEWSLGEFAALVGRGEDEVERWRTAGLPDSAGSGRFLDLASFTELTQTKGDRAAMQILNGLESTVRLLALDHDGKLVKQIGDALMLAVATPTRSYRPHSPRATTAESPDPIATASGGAVR